MTLRKSLLGAALVASTALTAISFATKATATTSPTTVGATAPVSLAWANGAADALPTATPIKHLVVIYDENISFDHYFGTYPTAANVAGEPAFTALAHTPTVNNLVTANLLTSNPNDTNTANGVNAANPFRLDRTQAASADQNHSYTPEQQAYDGGKMDLFPEYTGNGTTGGAGAFGTKGQVMGYFDGNTVTALWNYAQHFAMSDNAYSDTFGPSTPGAVEAVAGQTNGLNLVTNTANKTSNFVTNTDGSKTLVNDIDPAYDTCSSTTDNAMINAKNIGDLLNAAKITWGGFMGGFNLSTVNANGTTGCGRTSDGVASPTGYSDYIPHHNWFQYFASTANPTHARPASIVDIGYSFAHNGAADPANHQYDLNDFYASVRAGNYPAVSYIKLIATEDGHAGYSDPLDEQEGIVKLVNFLQTQPDWKNTAVIIAYDDSDGWYDHRFATPTQSSYDAVADQLDGSGVCGSGTAPAGVSGEPVNGRCGPGTRMPFIVISPYAKQNYVSEQLIEQSSIVRFVEDNWLKGERLGNGSFDASAGSINDLFNFTTGGKSPRLFLNDTTGEAAN